MLKNFSSPSILSARIRILTAIRQGQIGGGESHVIDLAENIDRSKFELVVLSFTDGPMVQKIRELDFDCHVIHTEKAFDYKIWAKVSKLIADENIDIVHAHGTRALSNVYRSSKKNNKPLVYSIHGWSFHDDQSFLRRTVSIRAEKFLTQKVDVNISVSESNQQTGIESLGNFKSVVVNNGVNLKRFDPTSSYHNIRKEFGLTSDDTVVGYFVRITKQKDPITLIKSFKLLRDKGIDNLKLVIVGEGDLEDVAKQLVVEYNLQDFIIFNKFRQDIPDLLNAIDIYCLPSLWEGLSIGLLEAMAMRKAIVATKVDGTIEVIRHNENGVLIDPGNVSMLAEALELLHKDPNLRQKLGLSAFETIEKEFSIENTVKKIESIYLDL